MNLNNKVIFVFLISFFWITVFSQKTEIYRFSEKDFNKGMELFRKEKRQSGVLSSEKNLVMLLLINAF